MICTPDGNHALGLSGHCTLIDDTVGGPDTLHNAVAGGFVAGAENYVYAILQNCTLSVMDQVSILHSFSDTGNLVLPVQLRKLHLHFCNFRSPFANKIVQSIIPILGTTLCV